MGLDGAGKGGRGGDEEETETGVRDVSEVTEGKENRSYRWERNDSFRDDEERGDGGEADEITETENELKARRK